MNIEQEFHESMLALYQDAKEQCGYNAAYFLQMVNEHGGVEAARRLLLCDTPAEGFTFLWEKDRLDLSVEQLVLQPKFRALFSEQERAIAHKRLSDCGYDFDQR